MESTAGSVVERSLSERHPVCERSADASTTPALEIPGLIGCPDVPRSGANLPRSRAAVVMTVASECRAGVTAIEEAGPAARRTATVAAADNRSCRRPLYAGTSPGRSPAPTGSPRGAAPSGGRTVTRLGRVITPVKQRLDTRTARVLPFVRCGQAQPEPNDAVDRILVRHPHHCPRTADLSVGVEPHLDPPSG